MGTSTGYDMPSGGDWGPLKNEATQFVKEEGQGAISPARLLNDYLRTNGGASGIARDSRGGGGSASSGGGGRRGSGGRSGGGGARTSGRNLGGFLSRVSTVGLDEALREAGLGGLVGRPAEEVAAGLLDALAAPGSTLDEHAARLAMAKLNDELLQNAETYEDVGQVLTQALDEQGLARILSSFFGHYLYERFCRDFYERWRKKVGVDQASRSLKSVKDYIESRIKATLTGRDVTRMNWRGREGLKIAEQVMQDTLEVFEVTA